MISKDPYKILGVSPTASDAEIKSAYKELVKKYHPDQYQDNPLADVAEEKMSEINAAYDQIMTSRRGGGSSYNSAGSGYDGYASSQGFDSGYIRSLIQSGSYTQADQMLDNVSSSERNAEWYFLKGTICHRRGWLNEAYNNFTRAVQLDPNNMEYQSVLAQMNRQRASCVAALGMKALTEGYTGAKVQPADEFVPDYLRKSQAERQREAEASPDGQAGKLPGDY